MIKTVNLKKCFVIKKNGFFRGKKTQVTAVDGVSLEISKSETLGLAGESGCGKTTLSKLILNLYLPSDGQIFYKGERLSAFKGNQLRQFRRNAQMIFQDPYESLNPRFDVKETLEEPLKIHKIGDRLERHQRIVSTLEEVGLVPVADFLERYPHELSGGQRQRVAIARALILNPTFLVADEPVSMLDLSIRAEILILLRKLIEKKQIAGLCISHDLSILRYLCQRTAIMYLGRIVEVGPTQEIINNHYHPYTEALLAAVPQPDPDIRYRLDKIKDELPSGSDLPEGCRFNNRCVKATDLCLHTQPKMVEVKPGHWVECHLYTNSRS